MHRFPNSLGEDICVEIHKFNNITPVREAGITQVYSHKTKLELAVSTQESSSILHSTS